jgi:4-coumarate--CoA ligase (photoactive yellow protein activation family)
MHWTIEQARRVILDLASPITGIPYTGNHLDYRPGQCLKNDLQLESVQVMDLAARVNACFHIMETSPENYLLSSSAVDDWALKCVHARSQQSDQITFFTSGTTDEARPVTHQQAFIDREINFLCEYFGDLSCIIPLVPAASIYGYLYTIALPQAAGAPVQLPSEVQWNQLSENALIVGTPFTWSHLMRSMPGLNLRAKGVCSTAPLPQTLYETLLSRGISLTEVYGATETAGVGLRKAPKDPFELFPYWTLQGATYLMDSDTGQAFSLMDQISPVDDRHFTVLHRKDQKLKIGGKLLDLEQLRDKILQLEHVRHCKLSAKRQSDRILLAAEITLKQDSTEGRAAFRKAVRARLSPAERPAEIHFSS